MTGSWFDKLRTRVTTTPSQPQTANTPEPVAESALDIAPRSKLSRFPARYPRGERAKPPFIDWSRTRSPTAQAMIVDDLKLIYLPIAKNACSSTKRLVASLGGLTLEKGQDIHYTLDKNNTGLQFKDKSPEDIKSALAAPDWMRFMVFRAPMDRLVSAYVEKFVNNREHPGQWETCGDVIRTVFHVDTATPEHFSHGITFREFAEYILARDPQQLDSHWQPQVFYMGHEPLTHMYDVKALDLLEDDLQAHIGSEISIPHMNRSRDQGPAKQHVPEAVDLLPKDLRDAKNLSLTSFLPQDLHGRLLEFYAADLSVYQQIKQSSALRQGHH